MTNYDIYCIIFLRWFTLIRKMNVYFCIEYADNCKKGSVVVIGPNDLARMKASLDNLVGQEIQLTLRCGKKRAVVRKGIIENTYPSIFVVRLQTPKNIKAGGRRISYSYTEMLTHAIEIVPIAEAE